MHVGTLWAAFAWNPWFETVYPQAPGSRTVVSSESLQVEIEAGEPDPFPEAVPVEIPAVEPLDLAELQEPLKIEVMPETAQIDQQMFRMKPTDMLRPAVALDVAALTVPVPAAAERSSTALSVSHRPQASETARPVARRPMSDLLAAISVQAVPLPAEAGTSEVPARPLHSNSPPIYPSQAITRQLEGRVVLRATITPEGQVLKLEVAESSGHPILDAAAHNTVRNWRFQPGRRGGLAVETILRLPIRFRLD